MGVILTPEFKRSTCSLLGAGAGGGRGKEKVGLRQVGWETDRCGIGGERQGDRGRLHPCSLRGTRVEGRVGVTGEMSRCDKGGGTRA